MARVDVGPLHAAAWAWYEPRTAAWRPTPSSVAIAVGRARFVVGWGGGRRAATAAQTAYADVALVVSLSEARAGSRILDVGAGRGRVTRELRAAGAEVVTADPDPSVQPDVVCGAEELPFADGEFDAVVTRFAAHFFRGDEPIAELARVSRGRVVVSDLLHVHDNLDEAHRLLDSGWVRSYGEDEWRGMFERAGLSVDAVERIDHSSAIEMWLARAPGGRNGTSPYALVAPHLDAAGRVPTPRIVISGTKGD